MHRGKTLNTQGLLGYFLQVPPPPSWILFSMKVPEELEGVKRFGNKTIY